MQRVRQGSVSADRRLFLPPVGRVGGSIRGQTDLRVPPESIRNSTEDLEESDWTSIELYRKRPHSITFSGARGQRIKIERRLSRMRGGFPHPVRGNNPHRQANSTDIPTTTADWNHHNKLEDFKGKPA
ncbi:hypothetical protein UPYG_G00290200 [Umbra pygmaea]|uniref:Uncharacterized protein n=1 Tax=Umbra pygmaea TaxID=75934 RepID=A0ABD0WQX3_UMBPY